VINTSTNTVTATITVESEPDTVASTPDPRPVGPSQPENRGACHQAAPLILMRSRSCPTHQRVGSGCPISDDHPCA
jgi:hypothetical protein